MSDFDWEQEASILREQQAALLEDFKRVAAELAHERACRRLDALRHQTSNQWIQRKVKRQAKEIQRLTNLSNGISQG